MAPAPFGCVVFGYASHSFGSVSVFGILLAVLCLDVILYCTLLLCMVEITSNSNTSQANEYKSTKSGRVAMRLPCCHFVFCGHFPPEETTDM